MCVCVSEGVSMEVFGWVGGGGGGGECDRCRSCHLSPNT